jgi:hypothetical protein
MLAFFSNAEFAYLPWLTFFSLSLWRTLIAKIFSVSHAFCGKGILKANEGGPPLGPAR